VARDAARTADLTERRAIVKRPTDTWVRNDADGVTYWTKIIERGLAHDPGHRIEHVLSVAHDPDDCPPDRFSWGTTLDENFLPAVDGWGDARTLAEAQAAAEAWFEGQPTGVPYVAPRPFPRRPACERSAAGLPA
jgi:hypothetical protein